MLDESTIVRVLIRDRIRILSWIDSFLSDAQLAEDCYQDLCAAAVVKDQRFEVEAHLLRWTLRVGRNKSIDLARRRTRQPAILDDDVLQALETRWFSDSSGARRAQAERVEKLRHCLGTLSDNSRRIVELRYVDSLKSARIAELLGRKVESVYRALARAHVALRECMEQS